MTVQKARRKNLPFVYASDIPGLFTPDLIPTELYLVAYDPHAGAGKGFIAIPSSDLGMSGGSIPDIQAADLGSSNLLRGYNSMAIGVSNYNGGKLYTATIDAGGVTVSLDVTHGDVSSKILIGESISITNNDTGEVIERRIDSVPAYGVVTSFDIDSPIDTTSTHLKFSQLTYGQDTLNVGVGNIASGNNSTNIGTGNETTQEAKDSLTIGTGHYANHYGVLMHGAMGSSPFVLARVNSGKSLGTKGDCQEIEVVLGAKTTDATATEIKLYDAFSRLKLPANGLWLYEVKVVAMQTAGAAGTIGDSYVAKFDGCIKQRSGTVTLIDDTPGYTKNDAAFGGAAVVSGDNVNKSLKITVTGEANKTIKWVATVRLTQTVL